MQAIFDFDNTLAQQQVYNNLGGPNVELAKSQPAEWWVDQFGGRDRVAMLRSKLDELARMGVKLYICSLNHYEIILEGLRRVGLKSLFEGHDEVIEPNVCSRGEAEDAEYLDGVDELSDDEGKLCLMSCGGLGSGRCPSSPLMRKKSWCDLPHTPQRIVPVRIIDLDPDSRMTKGQRIKWNLERRGDSPRKAIFLDDSLAHCQDVQRTNPGITVVNCNEVIGLSAQDLQCCIDFFSRVREPLTSL